MEAHSDFRLLIFVDVMQMCARLNMRARGVTVWCVNEDVLLESNITSDSPPVPSTSPTPSLDLALTHTRDNCVWNRLAGERAHERGQSLNP